jgi:PKD repeat protein
MKLTKKLLFTSHVLILLCFVIIPSITTAAVPAANFTGTPVSGRAPLTVQFMDTSTGKPTGWTWYFGDETYMAP